MDFRWLLDVWMLTSLAIAFDDDLCICLFILVWVCSPLPCALPDVMWGFNVLWMVMMMMEMVMSIIDHINWAGKKSHEIFRHGDDIAKVRFYNASVYAQQQEVSTHKQTQQHQNCLNADLINPLAQINTAWCKTYISWFVSAAFSCTGICFWDSWNLKFWRLTPAEF